MWSQKASIDDGSATVSRVNLQRGIAAGSGGVPFGLNVESVSIRKVEIEASVRLAARRGAELRR